MQQGEGISIDTAWNFVPLKLNFSWAMNFSPKDADDGVDSTVDSSGYPLASNHHIHLDDQDEDMEEDLEHERAQPNEVKIFPSYFVILWVLQCPSTSNSLSKQMYSTDLTNLSCVNILILKL